MTDRDDAPRDEPQRDLVAARIAALEDGWREEKRQAEMLEGTYSALVSFIMAQPEGERILWDFRDACHGAPKEELPHDE